MRLFIKIILIILLIVLFAVSLWYFNAKILLADIYFRQTRLFSEWPDTLDNYEKVLFYQPFEPYYQKHFAMDLMWGIDLFYQGKDSKIKILDLAIERMKKISDRAQVREAKVYLARIYALKANLTQDQDDFLLAEKAISLVSQISPQMAGVYNDWCQLKIYKKQWDQAEQMCKKAFYLYPDLGHPQLNQEHRQAIMAEMSQVYEKLGIIYRELGNYEKAEQMYIQILKFFPLDKPYIWKKIGDLYYLQGDLDTAIEKNFHGYTLNPKDPAWAQAISLLYQEKGDIESASYWQKKAVLK